MIYVAKALFYIFRELIFDSKDEYDTKSQLFNARKMIVLILLVSSLFFNILFFFKTAHFIQREKTHDAICLAAIKLEEEKKLSPEPVNPEDKDKKKAPR